MLPSYRNKSTDLLRKSIDWFLYALNGLNLNLRENNVRDYQALFLKTNYNPLVPGFRE